VAHERAKGWKIRRTLSSFDPRLGRDRQRYEFLRFDDRPPNIVDPLGEWVDDPSDASIIMGEHTAHAMRNEICSRNARTDVIYHAVVEA
jgi:hypothetical protein